MLIFKPFHIDSVPEIAHMVALQNYRACDYSIGGIYMWIRYFDYQYCIHREMLHIKCRAEDRTAFMLPVGSGLLCEAVGDLRDYCAKENISLQLCAVPQEALAQLPQGGVPQHTRQWDDYLYAAEALASYAGHALKDKRNRMNHFEKKYEYVFDRICADNIGEVCRFVEDFALHNKEAGDFFRDYENVETLKILSEWHSMPFVGYVVRVDRQIVGVIIGEKVNDTLFIHIEKAYRAYSGVNEWLTNRCVREMLLTHPDIRFVNREEDMGDEGLRRSKLSFDPLRRIKKYLVDYE